MVLELKPPPEPSFAALLPLWPTGVSYAVSYFYYRHSVGEPSPSFAICESRLRVESLTFPLVQVLFALRPQTLIHDERTL